jgi:glycosyltransferase involved in cell wall biosynthesis
MSHTVSNSPNVLYVGCVPVERSYHGSLLLYRLFQTLPPERLHIVEGYLGPSRTDRRLPNVRYQSLVKALPRLRTTRFAPFFDALLGRFAALDDWRLPKRIGGFNPDVVVTVAHGFAWRAAAAYATRRRLPLHLIVHDDWPGIGARTDAGTKRLNADFARIYRAAASRLCVSPAMAAAYTRRYGAEGTVLYPSRAPDAVSPALPAVSERPFTVAFAGTINTPGYVAALLALADALGSIGGHLLIYGPLTKGRAHEIGLARDNVTVGGLIDPQALPEHLVANSDALFLPMSFAEADRSNMEISFPSKLADYTLLRMPILLYGPPGCSAAMWAVSNPGALLVVNIEDKQVLSAAVRRLALDPELRQSLGRISGNAGDRDFSHAVGFSTFLHALEIRRASGQIIPNRAPVSP